MTLELSSCTYAYSRRQKPILANLGYCLPAGLTVLLGPNGAGKSTLLKLAASVTKPQHGRVTFNTLSAGTRSYRQKVAWMPQDITPMPTLTAREYVAYIGWLKGMGRTDAWQAANEALGRVGLSEKANVKSSQLSGGQLRRVGVAGALVHDAELLLLDEPTAGMDPHQRRVFRDILNNLATDVQVLISTHDIADLADEADHVTVLHRGEIIQTGSTRQFLAHTPAGTAPGRVAEGAYTALLMQHGAEY